MELLAGVIGLIICVGIPLACDFAEKVNYTMDARDYRRNVEVAQKNVVGNAQREISNTSILKMKSEKLAEQQEKEGMRIQRDKEARQAERRKQLEELNWYAGIRNDIEEQIGINFMNLICAYNFEISDLKHIKVKYEKERKRVLNYREDYLAEKFIDFVVEELNKIGKIARPNYEKDNDTCVTSNVWDDEMDAVSWDDEEDDDYREDVRSYTFQDDYGGEGDDMYDSRGEFREY